MLIPTKGTLLIANPFLKDPNFLRTVILMCENMQEGSFGFVLNKPFPLSLNKIVPEFENIPIPVYSGGPVQTDTLHFLHQYPDLIPGGEEITKGVFWGGNFESMKILLKNNSIEHDKIRFFLGYSGWSEGQLSTELKGDSWLTVSATQKLIFNTTAENVWKDSLKHLGGDYEKMINYPIDPQLN